MTHNLMETLKLTINNTKHTPKTQRHLQKPNFFKNRYFQKSYIHSNQPFPLIFMASLYFYFFPLFFQAVFRQYIYIHINIHFLYNIYIYIYVCIFRGILWSRLCWTKFSSTYLYSYIYIYVYILTCFDI